MIDTEVRLIIFFEAKDGEALYTQQKQVWEMTVDHELLMAKFRLKLKKVGKTTRPFREVVVKTASSGGMSSFFKFQSPGNSLNVF